jgi:hypothetical protein
MATLNIYIDESGTFDFTPKGSKYFILTAVSAIDCPALLPDFFVLKHELGVEEFHATEDSQAKRDRMYGILEQHCHHGCFEIDSIIAQKNRANPVIREADEFYARLLRILLKRVFRSRATDGIDHINVWAARIGTHKKKSLFEKTVKTYLAHGLKARLPYALLIHASASHPLLQVADYCCWAIAKKWKDGEMRPYQKIHKAVKTEFEVFRGGAKEYY